MLSRTQGLPKAAAIFTANLTVNYRRPMQCNTAYYVKLKATRLEKQKKIYLEV